MKNMDNLRVRKVEVNVKGSLIEYDEYYLVNENGEEIFDRNIEIENVFPCQISSYLLSPCW